MCVVCLEGVPELHFGFEQVKPTWLLAVGAVALLAGNKTVSGGRTFGKTNVHIPVVHQDSLAQVHKAFTMRGLMPALLSQLNVTWIGLIRISYMMRMKAIAMMAHASFMRSIISSAEESSSCVHP